MKRSILVIGGVVMLVLLLAGAAFVAGRLLNKEPAGSVAGGPMAGGGPMGGIAGGEGGAMVSMEVQIESAEELPDSPPDVVGPFVRREDNSIFVNEASGGMMVVAEGGGASTASSQADSQTNSQEIEIVVTGDTIVYKDVTNLEGPPSSGVVQQKVAPGSVDEIGENSVLIAWGERTGDRLVAHVLMYSEPMIFMAPGGD